ncbi:MAG: hypothetical protein JST89_09480 [Cyanobacteria bacterium SZAS-4]|nr:hypothetical protein [Cyanobacteria bacterium SZAS-4]
MDWPNQVWLANYVASFLVERHYFPGVIHTYNLIGMPYPVFYGYLFFPLMGVLSFFWNADLTVRFIAVALYALQFCLLFKLASKVMQEKLPAFCVATFVTWAIYPMTNLYNRGAIPEFFATGLLVCAAVIWFFALDAESGLRRFLLCNLFVILFVISAGSHPITALYGACFMAILVASTLLISRVKIRELILPILIPVILGMSTLLPWVMVTTKFTPQMALAASFKHVGYYPRSLDSLYARLMPFPLETKSYKHKLIDDRAKTPHLDTQINFPLLLLFIICIVATSKSGAINDRRVWAAVATFGVLVLLMIWSSTTKGTLDKLGHNFRTIQFAYRLVSYINFSLLFGTMLLFWRNDKKLELLKNTKILCSLLLLSFAGLSIKLFHAQQVMVPVATEFARTKPFTTSLLKMPDSFYGSDAYTLTNLFPELTPDRVAQSHNCPFEPSTETFGTVRPVASPIGVAQTNIQQFPWNHIFQKGGEVERLEHDHRIAVDMPKSVELHYEFVPDVAWAQARNVSLSVFFLWLIVTKLASFALITKAKG